MSAALLCGLGLLGWALAVCGGCAATFFIFTALLWRDDEHD
jgi:hypothetical protein